MGTPGTMDVTVPKKQVMMLPPGDYRDITVRGTLILKGGIYNIRSLKVKHKAQLLFDAATEIRVARRVDTESQVVIGPHTGASITAADIVFYVQGSNGGAGKPVSTPFAVTLGERSQVEANVYAPNGTVRLEKATMATGAFLGQHVRIGSQAQIRLDSFVAP
jgi:hypothetical protein